MENVIRLEDRPAVFLALFFVPGAFIGVTVDPQAALAAACAGIIAGFWALCKSGSAKIQTAMAALLLLSCGMAAGIRGQLYPDATFDFPLARRCCESLRQLIDGLPFQDSRHPALLKALLTGDRSSLDRDTVGIFRKSGASHILALSGLHLGIIYTILSKLTGIGGGNPLARRIGAVIIIAATAFFTLMTGAGPSIVRAFLFILLREGAMIAGRRISLLRCYCIALVLQLSLSPSSLLKSGFQLSYLAMLGICLLMPVLQGIYPSGRFKGPMKRMWDIAALSISCQAFTAPLSWKLFGTFPRYFLVTNLLAMPLVTLLMVSAVVCVSLSAAGICPQAVVELTGHCCRLLMWTLSTICLM